MDERIRVVIVDDHKLMRETWKMIIQRHPQIEVIAECSSGEEAIQVAKNEIPDVMLMDINMAPVNGFEATRKIATAQPEVRIIGLSINNLPTYARNLMQLGARGYVTKNSSAAEMLEAIMTVYSGGTYICQDVQRQMTPKGD